MTAGATEADREARATPALDGLTTDDQGPQVANADDPAGILRSGLLAGLDPGGLADRFGTPLYVYDLDLVDRQVDRLRAVLPEPVELAYALKANPSLAVVAHLGRRGLGADIASAGELATALRAGIAPGSIVFTGPGKGEAELALAVERDPGGDGRVAGRARAPGADRGRGRPARSRPPAGGGQRSGPS